jgi:hypothetical protein
MRKKMLTFLAVMALAAVICLPGMASADINLDFDGLTAGDSLASDYEGFAWTGEWTVVNIAGNAAVSSSNGATISYSTPFNFDGASFKAGETGGATKLTIKGYLDDNLVYSFDVTNFASFPTVTPINFSYIDKLTFASNGVFAMDNFMDTAVVPLPGALVLLGAGLVRLAAYSRRKRAMA